MMMAHVIPPGHASLIEARRRASDRWGVEDGRAKLLGLLVSDKLHAVWPDTNTAISMEFWKSKEGHALLDASKDILLRMKQSPPVILETELQNEIPTVWELNQKRAVEKRLGHQKGGNSITKNELSPGAKQQPLAKGRPPKVGNDDFWIEVARMIYEGEQGTSGTTQEAFKAAILQSKVGGIYADDTVGDKIEKIWRALQLGTSRRAGK